MEELKTNGRVRLNFSETAKGKIQIDATVEFETVEQCGVAMRKILDEAKLILKEKGLQEVETVS